MRSNVNNVITRDFLVHFNEAWNRHDLQTLLSMMTEDAVMYTNAGAESHRMQGHAELRAGLSRLFERMPDAQWCNARHFVDGDRGITQWTFTATGVDGGKVEAMGCDFFTFRDGLIAIKKSHIATGEPRR